MNENDNDGTSDIGGSSQPGVSNPEDRLSPHQERDATCRQDARIDEQTADPSREKLIALREIAVELREKAADLREDVARLHEGGIVSHERIIHSALTEPEAPDDHLGMLQHANAQLVVAVIEAQKLAEQIETTRAQFHHLAHHDVLTGLPNRMLLRDRLSQAIELARRQGTQLAVLFMDLDRFKQINDSLGHAVGDLLLQSVAQRLRCCVRHSDTISRQGGDEFLVLLSSVKEAGDAAVSAQRILASLTAPHLIDQLELQISMSIGISTYPNDGQDEEALLKNADSAMYHAKENGRNNYKFFEHKMNVRAVQRLSIETSLRRALERQEFVLFYQPKIDFHTNRIVGVEALIRWQHPEREMVPPSQFVPIAEDCGLIVPIGRWVLREACIQAQTWRQAGLPPIMVAVNISAREFSARDFLDNIRATLEETGLESRYLELEVTERLLMRDATLTDPVLHALTELGVKLVIDDFGIGYSSLSNLSQFPIGSLKIDHSFVNRMTSDPYHATIVSAVISMGKSLKLRVIAAGVETPEQHAFLLAQHCDEGQGYYFGRPVTADTLTALLKTDIPPVIKFDS